MFKGTKNSHGAVSYGVNKTIISRKKKQKKTKENPNHPIVLSVAKLRSKNQPRETIPKLVKKYPKALDRIAPVTEKNHKEKARYQSLSTGENLKWGEREDEGKVRGGVVVARTRAGREHVWGVSGGSGRNKTGEGGNVLVEGPEGGVNA